jgi:hypothetical protein
MTGLTQATLAKYIIQQTRHCERDQRRLRDGALLHLAQSNRGERPSVKEGPERKEILDRGLAFSQGIRGALGERRSTL